MQTENPLNHQIQWQQYTERIESLSLENRVSRFCMEAGFVRIVEVGQYFMTKDTGEQFFARACREYTLPRDDPASQPKGGIQGNMRIGPVLEVTTIFKKIKYGIEIRIWSVGQDNSQSWVRISFGTIKYVVDSNQKIPTFLQIHKKMKCHKQVLSRLLQPDQRQKANPQQREPVNTPTTIPMHERRWIEPSEQTLSAYDLSWKVISLLRHNQTVQREEDGQFNSIELNFIFEIIPHKYSIGLMIVGNLVRQQEEVRKEDVSIALIIREESFTSELFKDTLEIISLILRYRTM